MNARFVAISLIMLSTVPQASAVPQMDKLTSREAERLLDVVPEIVQMRGSGLCPSYSPSSDLPEGIQIQVRIGCGPDAGQLLGGFMVDRSTGTVTGVDPNISLLDKAGESLARQMVMQARKRMLSPGEAICLARKAVEALPGCGGQEAIIKAKPFGPTVQTEATLRYVATCRRPSVGVQTGATLSVDLARATTREDGDGRMIMSGGLAELTSRIVGLRAEPRLTDEDVGDIALVVPSISHALLSRRSVDRCIVSVGDGQASDESAAVLVCKGESVPNTEVVVNTRTGAVRADALDRRDLEAASALAMKRLKAVLTCISHE